MNWFFGNPSMVTRVRAELTGKVLGCGCVPKYCHGWVLAAVANCSEADSEMLCAACTDDNSSPYCAAIEYLCVDESSRGHGKGRGHARAKGKGNSKGYPTRIT